ncbi:uncharacterized protein LOC112162389 [Oryzias melastigma]|uniref:uncharacterized protein LOC112162389 n=1 Tax=Oryzias melastigma TaxID=30732 RepID=UPI000CF7BD5B|nr:uncharacterized protein LOC112162389 [Oryzias melastigma]
MSETKEHMISSEPSSASTEPNLAPPASPALQGSPAAGSLAATQRPRPSKKHKCPLCLNTYTDVGQHLKKTERIANKDELKLLQNMAHQHFLSNLDCPLPGCKSKQIQRLDKHFFKVHKLQKPLVVTNMELAKRLHVSRELALLRATNPHPPMVSFFDLVDEGAIRKGVAREEAAAAARREEPSEIEVKDSKQTPPSSKKGKRASSLPAPGCRDSQKLHHELQVVKRLLKSEVRKAKILQERLLTLQEKTPKVHRRPKYSLSQAPLYVKLLEEFRHHTEGANPSRKDRENAQQRVTHVRKFLEFMCTPQILSADMKFLKKIRNVEKFTCHLTSLELKPRTIKAYLTDVVSFLRYICVWAPPSVKMNYREVQELLTNIKTQIRKIVWEVTTHQVVVCPSKSENLIESEVVDTFIKKAPRLIERALDLIEENPRQKGRVSEFFGLLGGYLVATTGLRTGVILNLSVAEMKNAKVTKDGGRIILISEQNTWRYYGWVPPLPLAPEEYAWVERYLRVRDRVKGGSKAPTFFHTSTGQPLFKLRELFKQAWEKMGLGAGPSFKMLRSASHQADNHGVVAQSCRQLIMRDMELHAAQQPKTRAETSATEAPGQTEPPRKKLRKMPPLTAPEEQNETWSSFEEEEEWQPPDESSLVEEREEESVEEEGRAISF